MRKLIAALEQLRARLNLVIAELESGSDERAAEELEGMKDDFRTAMNELDRH